MKVGSKQVYRQVRFVLLTKDVVNVSILIIFLPVDILVTLVKLIASSIKLDAPKILLVVPKFSPVQSSIFQGSQFFNYRLDSQH